MSDTSPHAQTAEPLFCEICGTSLIGITAVNKRCSPCFWHRTRMERAGQIPFSVKPCAHQDCPFDASTGEAFCSAHQIPKIHVNKCIVANCTFDTVQGYYLCSSHMPTAEIQMPPSDNVNHPKHYNAHPSGVECITVVEHMNFNIGNAIKYLWRESHKNGIEDLKKSIWYINREIERLETLNAKTSS